MGQPTTQRELHRLVPRLTTRQKMAAAELAPSVAELRGQTMQALVDRFASHDYRLTSLRGEPLGPADLERLLAQRASMNVFARHDSAPGGHR